MKKFLIILLFPIFIILPQNILATSMFDVVINEIAWMGTENSANDEWIELYNNTNQDINLDGWGLYESGGETLIEPLIGIIKSKSYYLIERTDDTTVPNISASQKPSGWGGHGLKNSGEFLQLLDNISNLIDEVNCSNKWFAGDNETKKTMERISSASSENNSSNWQTSQNPEGTPKRKNYESKIINHQPEAGPPWTEESAEPAPLQTEKSADTTELPKTYPDGIIFNEIVPSPDGPDSENEWLELINFNNTDVDVSGWKIQDTIGSIKTYIFPKGTKISTQGFLVLSRPTTKITLNNGGDTLNLIQPNKNIADTVTYDKAPSNQSYNRIGSEWEWSSNLTPNSPNIIYNPQPVKKDNSAKKSESFINFKSQKDLATVSEQIPKSSKPLSAFLVAFTTAIFSAVIILILKRKLTKEEF